MCCTVRAEVESKGDLQESVGHGHTLVASLPSLSHRPLPVCPGITAHIQTCTLILNPN